MKTRWFQFRLKTLLILVGLCAPVLAILARGRTEAWSMAPWRKDASGGCVCYDLRGEATPPVWASVDTRERFTPRWSRVSYLLISQLPVLRFGGRNVEVTVQLGDEGQRTFTVQNEPSVLVIKADGTAVSGPLPVTRGEFQELINALGTGPSGDCIRITKQFIQERRDMQWSQEILEAVDEL